MCEHMQIPSVRANPIHVATSEREELDKISITEHVAVYFVAQFAREWEKAEILLRGTGYAWTLQLIGPC